MVGSQFQRHRSRALASHNDWLGQYIGVLGPIAGPLDLIFDAESHPGGADLALDRRGRSRCVRQVAAAPMVVAPGRGLPSGSVGTSCWVNAAK